MIRLIGFALVLVIAGVVWASKKAAGAILEDSELQNSTFKGQTQKTMDKTARGLNWLEKQWDEAKSDAAKQKGLASREFKDYDK